MIKRIYLSLVVLGLSFSMIAQIPFKKGYIIKTEGDTLSGEVKFDCIQNQSVVALRNGSLSKEYNPSQVKRFQISGGERYDAKTIISEINKEEKEVFLRVVILSAINIYEGYSETNGKRKFYVSSASEENLIESKTKNDLLRFFQDCEVAAEYLKEIKTLNNKSLLKLNEKLIICQGKQTTYEPDITLRRSGTKVGVVGGIQMMNYEFNANAVLPREFNPDTYASSNIGLEGLFFFKNRKLISLGLITYLNDYNSSDDFFERRPTTQGISTVEFDWQNWTTIFNFNFDLGTKKRYAFFTTGFGATLITKATASKTFETQETIDLLGRTKHRQLRFNFGTGYQFDNWRIAVNYEYAGTSRQVLVNDGKLVSVRVSYFPIHF